VANRVPCPRTGIRSTGHRPRSRLHPISCAIVVSGVLVVGVGCSSSTRATVATTSTDAVAPVTDSPRTTVVIAPEDKAFCAQAVSARRAMDTLSVGEDDAGALTLMQGEYNKLAASDPPAEVAAELARIRDRFLAAQSMGELEANGGQQLEDDSQKYEGWLADHCGELN
jgi:hypothetical protein